MAKTKEDIYRDKLSHLHDQLTVQGYRIQKISQACGQDDGPLVDLVTREQAAKILGFSLRETDRRVHGLTKFITEYTHNRTFYKKRDIEELARAHTVEKLLYFWDDFS